MTVNPLSKVTSNLEHNILEENSSVFLCIRKAASKILLDELSILGTKLSLLRQYRYIKSSLLFHTGILTLLLTSTQFFRGSQIFCGSRSASAHLRWSRDTNRLYCKYVKIISQRAVRSENLT